MKYYTLLTNRFIEFGFQKGYSYQGIEQEYGEKVNLWTRGQRLKIFLQYVEVNEMLTKQSEELERRN